MSRDLYHADEHTGPSLLPLSSTFNPLPQGKGGGGCGHLHPQTTWVCGPIGSAMNFSWFWLRNCSLTYLHDAHNHMFTLLCLLNQHFHLSDEGLSTLPHYCTSSLCAQCDYYVLITVPTPDDEQSILSPCVHAVLTSPTQWYLLLAASMFSSVFACQINQQKLSVNWW